MISELTASFGSAFFQRALIEVVVIGALGGVVGAHVLLRRLPFYVVAVSHATFPGAVIASMLGASLFVGGTVAGLLVALAVVSMGSSKSLDDSSAVGVVLAGAFALGVVLLVAQPSHGQQLTTFLVGSILTVSSSDLWVGAVVSAVICASLVLIHKELVLNAFDPVSAHAIGFRPGVIEFIMLAIVTITCVVAIPAVGTLLAVALLTIPALTARLWTDRLLPMMVLAGLFGMFCGVAGLCASAVWQVAAGGAIAIACTSLYLLTLMLKYLRK